MIEKMNVETARAFNNLARHKMIKKIYSDILCDMTVCEIEGWDRLEYIKQLQDVLNHFKIKKGVLNMWELKNGGDFAVNEESGAVIKMALCKDGLVRVKRNYKTIATFETVSDAKKYIAELVEKMNGAE